MPSPESILKRFNSVKTLPHVAIRLTKLISDEESQIKEFNEIIRLDPTLVVRILRVVNSSYYGLRSQIEDISKAVVYIGMRNLRNMVVTEALKDIFKGEDDSELFSRRGLWLHCAAVSVCNTMIAERIFGLGGEDAFLCGILHDIGIIVEQQVVQGRFLAACRAHQATPQSIVEYENKFIGTDHTRLGYLLAREWRLPLEVQAGIRDHHQMQDKLDPKTISGINQLSEYFVNRMKYLEIPGMKATLSPPLAVHVKKNIGEYRTLVKDLPEEMAKAKELYELNE